MMRLSVGEAACTVPTSIMMPIKKAANIAFGIDRFFISILTNHSFESK